MRCLIPLLLFLSGVVFCQSTPQNSSLILTAPTPPIVTEIGASVTSGSGGINQYFYWVVAVYPIGRSAISNYAQLNNVPNIGSVTIGWNQANGAIGYDVLRTTTNAIPNPLTCNCALVINQSPLILSYTDTLGITISYASITNFAQPARWEQDLNNRDYILPTLVDGTLNINRIYNGSVTANNIINTSQTSAPINVIAKGADPTGTIDSSIAIQAAYTTACTIPYGRGVYYPPGTYTVSIGITITCDKIVSYGDSTRPRIHYTGSSNLFTIAAVTGTAVEFRDLYMYGNQLNNTNGIVFPSTSGVSNSAIENCSIYAFGGTTSGAQILIASGNANGIQSLTIRHNDLDSGYNGIELDSPTDNLDISGSNQILAMVGWGISASNQIGAGAININGNNIAQGSVVQGLGCIFITNGGIYNITHNQCATASHSVLGTNSTGFDLGTAIHYNVSDNNINLLSNATSGIHINSAIDYSNFDRNTITGYVGYGILILSSTTHNSFSWNSSLGAANLYNTYHPGILLSLINTGTTGNISLAWGGSTLIGPFNFIAENLAMGAYQGGQLNIIPNTCLTCVLFFAYDSVGNQAYISAINSISAWTPIYIHNEGNAATIIGKGTKIGGANLEVGGGLLSDLYKTATNCTSNASPAVCGSAASGAVAIPTGVSSVTLQVNTTAVTANSRIMLLSDDSLTIPSTTCNSTLATLVGGLAVTARNPGVSFTVTYNATIATNPLCISYNIIN